MVDVVATADPWSAASRLRHALHAARGSRHGRLGANTEQRLTADLVDHVLPAAGTTCRQELPFAQPPSPSVGGSRLG